MTTERRLGIVVVVAAVAAGIVWWGFTADDRRVDAACDIWVGERLRLTHAFDETVEAAERAAAAGAPTVAPDFYNDNKVTYSVLQRWVEIGPDVSGTLHSRQDWGDDEQGAVTAFESLDQQVGELVQMLEKEPPAAVLSWIDLLQGTTQFADEVCLYAARD